MQQDHEPSLPDLISQFKSNQGPKALLTEDETRVNASLFMIAGSETTATLLSGRTFFLLDRSDTYYELRSQIRSSIQTYSDTAFSSTARIPYLQAVLQETLRLYPPTPLGMPRVVPEEGAMIPGKFVAGKVLNSSTPYRGLRC